MGKKRVYEIAKSLNISNKELMDSLKAIGIEVKNHMSGLTDEQEERVTKHISEGQKAGNKVTQAQVQQNNNQGTAGQKPQGHKPQNQGQRPQGQNQQQGQRPQGQNQNQGQRPQGQNQGQGQRPQQQGQRNQGQRPQGQQQGQRPQGQNQQQGQRPQGQNQQQGQRPQGQSQNQGQRPQGQNQGQRPQQQGQRPQNQNQGQRPQQQGQKNNNNRNTGKKGFEQKKTEQVKEVTKVEEKVIEEADEIKIIKIPETLTVKELSEYLGKTTSELIKRLMLKGVMAGINQEIDFETASEISEEFGFLVEILEEIDIFQQIFEDEEEDSSESLVERPPVVVVMGHVDHGKTSLLDRIRKSNVVNKEAGGITQHIGAYTVSVDNKPITFLDTPGHEAFTAMRMRGAQVTDIAVLVVAADDGVMPQTIEAINHAKAAKVEIIVAINKMDKPGANPDRVKQELAEYGLMSEDWGGETICVPVSASTGMGIDNLLEMIILAAEMKELKANPNKRARGTVIEALLDKGRGPVATVLVQEGTLKVGDPIVAGATFGKIRAMMDDKGRRAKKAGPSIPVEILGLSEVPLAGDVFYIAKSEKESRHIAESVIEKDRISLLKASQQKVSLDDLFDQIQAGNVKELNIVVKADVQGSVEAVKSSLERLSTDEVRIRTIHGGVGAITESDVMLASASNAIIIGFNVRPEPSAKKISEDEKVDMKLYRVIYSAIEDIQAAIKGMLDPVYKEKVTGHAEIRQIFKASSIGTIGGSYVTDGKITRNSLVRIVRDGIVVYEGSLDTLKRFKDDVKEVNAGYECGLLFSKFNDIKEGDKVEAYIMEEIPR